MSMQWVTPRDDSPWAFKSSDGYYGISVDHDEDDIYRAFHIEALWARPAEIGHGQTLSEAKQVCEQHAAQPRA